MKQFSFTLETPSDFRALALLRRLFKSLKLRRALPLTQILVEAYTNAVRHGNKNHPDKKVRVSIQIEEKRVLMKIRDEGKGFRFVAKRPHLWRSGGRGLELIHHHADSVRHSRHGKFHTIEITCNR